jgi:molybdate transport system substrate-binding protein
MKRIKYLGSATFALAFVFAISTTAHAQNEITVLASGPARRPIDKILEKFQAQTKYKVNITYQSGMVARQSVAKGQGLDVSILIAPYPGAIASGTIIPSSATPIASLPMALGVLKGAARPDISTPGAIKGVLLGAKSIGFEDPDFTTSGQGAFSAISRLGIADQIATKSKVMLGPASAGISPDATAGAKPTQKRLEDKEIDFAILYLSDMFPNDKIDIVGVLPREISPPSPLVGFISTKASNPAGAKELLDYLASPAAQTIFKAEGYEPPR